MVANPAEVGEGLVFMAFERVVEAEVASGFGLLVVIDRRGQEGRLVDLATEQLDDRIRPGADVQFAGLDLESCGGFRVCPGQSRRKVAKHDRIRCKLAAGRCRDRRRFS